MKTPVLGPVEGGYSLAATVLTAPLWGPALLVGAAKAASVGGLIYGGKQIGVAVLETSVEYAVASRMGDESFSLGGSLARNSAFNLTFGLLPGAAETKFASRLGGVGKYALHYGSEVAVGTTFDTAWEVGVNGRDLRGAFTESLVGNMIGQGVGDVVSAGLRRGMAAAGIEQFGRVCFVAGTIVIRGDAGRQPIEQIELGGKVQPRDVNYVETNEPDPASWRKITLCALNAADADVEIELLRPLTWLESQDAQRGSVVHVEIAELHLNGYARVLKIEPCPQIQSGNGAVVTGRFSHVSTDLVEIWVEGLDDPIAGTSRHPFWSVTRQTWVPACELQSGELLETNTGTAQVVSVGFHNDDQRVYNLEVACLHEYRVSDLAILVHNASTYTQRLNQTPSGRKVGKKTDGDWSGPRGESVFTSTFQNTLGLKAPYSNARVDLTGHAKYTVHIEDFVTKVKSAKVPRLVIHGEADAIIAARLKVDPSLIEKFRKKNKFTWHEVDNLGTLQLVPTAVNANFTHLGGISEALSD